MAEKALISIEVVLAGRKYPVKATADKADVIAKIAEQLNVDMHDIQLSYADRDRQDCLAMTLLRVAMELESHRENLTAMHNLVDQVID